MSELYLIAHKVRGEPAFDIATQIECPLCAGHSHGLDGVCHECDSTGFWWIVPTSGHRAYPYWNTDLENIDDTFELTFSDDHRCMEGPGFPPEGLPDHYPTRATPDAPKLNLSALMPKAEPIRRRV